MGNTRKYVAFSILLIILCTVSLSAAGKDNQTKERYIVKLKTPIQQGVSIQAMGAEKIMELESINAIVVNADAKQFDDLKNDSNVEYIIKDLEVKAMADTIPWGITRIKAPQVWNYNNTGQGIKIAIIDTGIDFNHQDLVNNVKGGFSFVGYTNSYMDDNGHGTHVAGTAAAALNGIGVVGGAHGASLYAVKVLDNNGSGSDSQVIQGIEWAINNNMNVISMSLGTYQTWTTATCNNDHPAMRDVINNAVNAGIVVVAAAGNNGSGGVSSPGCIGNTIAVGATDSNNVLAVFSSRGAAMADHGVVAPGASILSTVPGNSYASWSGTSMATPHVSGAVALLLNSPIPPQYDTNNNGKWDPLEVRKRLQDTALDLGNAGNDNSYGYGLIDISAAAATQPLYVIFFDNVESGTNGWTSMGLWHITTRKYSSTSHSWWYGQESTGNYDIGTNSGYLTSQAISLVGVINPKLSFMSWYKTEDTGTAWDKKKVQISANGGATWVDLKQISDTPSQWNLETIELSSFAGQTIKIRFYFNTVDNVLNNFEGWYIDDVKIETPVPLNPLYISISESPDPVTSGNTSQVIVHVSTTGSVNVSNASVSVSATGGILNPMSGTTDINGDFKPIYNAPSVASNTTFTISATASKTGYASSAGNGSITVYPGPPLYVSVSEFPDPVTSGNTSVVTVHINTTGGANVSNASVSVSATGGILNPRSGTTDINGDFKSNYTAPIVTGNTTFTISATASRAGYAIGTCNGTIMVNPSLIPGIIFFDNFESGPAGWTNTNLWHITTKRSNSSSHSWWYGQELTGNYYTGKDKPNLGFLTSPAISLFGVTNPKLSFMSWYEVEPKPYGTVTYDQMWVQISIDSGATWINLLKISDAKQTWNIETINLSGYAGKTIRIRFYFNTVDGLYNNFEGWYIDDVKIVS